MQLTHHVATINKTSNQIEEEILKVLKMEKIEIGKHTYVLDIPRSTLKPTTECHLRDGIRYANRAIKRLQFYKEDFFELDKSEKKSLSHIIECYKCKVSQLQNFLYQLKLDKKPKNKKNKHGKIKKR